MNFTYILVALNVGLLYILFYLHTVLESGAYENPSSTVVAIHDTKKFITDLESELSRMDATATVGATAASVELDSEKERDQQLREKLESSFEEEHVRLETGNPMHMALKYSSEQWTENLYRKLLCMQERKGAIYFYHSRKAAGTTLREILEWKAKSWRVNYYETEGQLLNPNVLDYEGIMTVISLRDPISRALSLYWYEHVGWYHGILKQTSKCKTLKEWVAGWRDGSAWKIKFLAANKDSNYVEIENYYTKFLAGWDGQRTLTEADFEKAKRVLERFDMIFLTEWMGDDSQIDAMNALFPGRNAVSASHKVAGDYKTREKLASTLAPDLEDIKVLLSSMNDFDIRLFDYAQSLMAYRLKLIAPIIDEVHRVTGSSSYSHSGTSSGPLLHGGAKPRSSSRSHQPHFQHKECSALRYAPDASLRKSFGIFRPPGHKGPLD